MPHAEVLPLHPVLTAVTRATYQKRSTENLSALEISLTTNGICSDHSGRFGLKCRNAGISTQKRRLYHQRNALQSFNLGNSTMAPPPQNKIQKRLIQPAIKQFRRSPLLTLAGIWFSMMLGATMALHSLLTLGPSAEPSPSPTSIENVEPSANSGSLSIWSFGAIALSCAFVSLMVAQRLRQSTTTKKLLIKLESTGNSFDSENTS